jgi:hypothetical protein
MNKKFACPGTETLIFMITAGGHGMSSAPQVTRISRTVQNVSVFLSTESQSYKISIVYNFPAVEKCVQFNFLSDNQV